jgi:hypothetical protein
MPSKLIDPDGILEKIRKGLEEIIKERTVERATRQVTERN